MKPNTLLLASRAALGVSSRLILSKRAQSTLSRKWSTPLAESLAKAITTTGPIPVASFMRQCLTSPEGGYYTQTHASGRDPFGKTGDFITAPEISQVFGELAGLWVVAEWMKQGKKSSGVQLIELGPGRGTLMDDMLRTMQNFKDFVSSLETIYLVEASPMLREKQHKLLCEDEPLHETAIGHESKIKYASRNKIVWVEDMKLLPPSQQGHSPFILAHEFFDALPIHIFQSIPQAPKPTSTILTSPNSPPRKQQPAQNEWREFLVSVTAPSSSSSSSSSPLPSSTTKQAPEFELILSKKPTPHSASLPTLSKRYTSLLSSPHSTIEISPESLSTISSIADRIGQTPSGGALIIDYGPSSTIPANSLRGIRAHELVSPFSAPGLVDLSASVDFTGLAHAAVDASEGVEVHGPVNQGYWLNGMGGDVRRQALVKGTDDEGAERINGAWKRLVDMGPKGMGQLYQVMAIVPVGRANDGGVVGFGGDL